MGMIRSFGVESQLSELRAEEHSHSDLHLSTIHSLHRNLCTEALEKTPEGQRRNVQILHTKGPGGPLVSELEPSCEATVFTAGGCAAYNLFFELAAGHERQLEGRRWRQRRQGKETRAVKSLKWSDFQLCLLQWAPG